MHITAATWAAISNLLDEALELEPDQRPVWLERAVRERPDLAGPLREFLAAHASCEKADFLQALPSLPQVLESHRASGAVGAGDCVGPYRLLREIGAGGMALVWLAARFDGALSRTVALKLPQFSRLRPDLEQRFARERDILARLEHPHIARLYDAGLADDGLPYLAIEYVDGEPITVYCDRNRLGIHARLALFAQVLEAVQYAHAHLIIHRDLKPSNILVTTDGQVRLLDFGIAKLLADEEGAAQTQLTQVAGRVLTPDYASPEQINGALLTTATDIYSLGVVLYELLTGMRPYQLKRDSRGALDEAIFAANVRRPSTVIGHAAAGHRGTTLAQLARVLRGDLDTIVMKALKKEPEGRFATAAAFGEDLARYQRGDAVLARPDSVWYRTGKFLRRNRAVAAAIAGVVLALTVGTAAALWQARIASEQASKERATKEFLISVFKASDPRTASDKPRGTITAKELLDLGAAKIEREFVNDPETKVALLGLMADIYGELDENETFGRLNARQIELARALYGDAHPIVINGLLRQADDAATRGEFAQSLALLDQIDPLIKRAGLDRSAERAYWWLARGYALGSNPQAGDERTRALEKAVELYAAAAPDDSRYAFSLSALGGIYHGQGDYARAREYTRRGIEVAQRATDRDEGALSVAYSNLGKTLAYDGDFEAAERAYESAVQLAEQTYGTDSWYYWVAAANRAQTAHLRGDRLRAHELFDTLLPLVSQRSKTFRNAVEENSAARVFETYAMCLLAEGRPRLALRWLQIAENEFANAAVYPYDVHHVQGQLGRAYDGLGDADEARKRLKRALDGYAATFVSDDPAVLEHRYLWGRFLFDHGDTIAAADQFQEILVQSHGRNLWFVARAEGELASMAVARGDTAAALVASARALAVFEHVTGFRDVRMEPDLWRIRAQVLLASGDATGAAESAQCALSALRRYDDPSSPEIAAAEATLHAAQSNARSR